MASIVIYPYLNGLNHRKYRKFLECHLEMTSLPPQILLPLGTIALRISWQLLKPRKVAEEDKQLWCQESLPYWETVHFWIPFSRKENASRRLWPLYHFCRPFADLWETESWIIWTIALIWHKSSNVLRFTEVDFSSFLSLQRNGGGVGIRATSFQMGSGILLELQLLSRLQLWGPSQWYAIEYKIHGIQ